MSSPSSVPALPPDLAAALDGATGLVRESAFFATAVTRQAAALARACLEAIDLIHEPARVGIQVLHVQLAAVRSDPVRFGDLAAATAHEMALLVSLELDRRIRCAIGQTRGLYPDDPNGSTWFGIASGRGGVDLNYLFDPSHFPQWAPHFDSSGLSDSAAVGLLLAELQLEARRAAALRQQAPPLDAEGTTSPQGAASPKRRGRKRGSKTADKDTQLFLDWKAAHRTTGLTTEEFVRERGLPASALSAIERGRANVKRRRKAGRNSLDESSQDPAN
jgi:hypothetical protein